MSDGPPKLAQLNLVVGPGRPGQVSLPSARWGAAGSGWWLPTAAVAARPAPLDAPLPGAVASGSWRIQPTPNPVMPNGSLGAVSCTKTAGVMACTAVGGYENQSGTGLTLAERRTGGGTWAVQATPNPAEVWSGLSGVSCPTATDCTAVGWSVTAAGREFSLAQRWDGRRWTVRPVPSPAGATDTGLFGVSCTAARACTAVGEYVTAGGAARPFAVRWNGSRWAIQPVPIPPKSTAGELSGISCGPGGICLAAGARPPPTPRQRSTAS